MVALDWPAIWCRFDEPQRWPWVAAAAVAIVLLARMQGRAARSPGAIFRLFAAAVTLLALLEPVVSRPRRPSEAGAILLLLDASRSMSVADSFRTAGQRVALARAMGRLAPGAIDPEVDRLREYVNRLLRRVDAVVAARAELDYARLVGRRATAAREHLDSALATLHADVTAPPEFSAVTGPGLQTDLAAMAGPGPNVPRDVWLNRLPPLERTFAEDVDRAASDADAAAYQSRTDVRAACDDLAGQSRLQLERLAAMRVQGMIHTAVDPDMAVKTFAFASGVRGIDLHSTDLDGLSLSSFGEATQLAAAVNVCQDAPANTVVAALLFSDGRPIGPHSADLARGGDASRPIFTVQVVPGGAPRLPTTRAPTTSAEMKDLSGRGDLLRRIARSSGGRYCELEEIDSLSTPLKAAAFAPRPPVQWRLSAGPAFFAVIVGCFAIDWSLRKRAGLP